MRLSFSHLKEETGQNVQIRRKFCKSTIYSNLEPLQDERFTRKGGTKLTVNEGSKYKAVKKFGELKLGVYLEGSFHCQQVVSWR